MSAVAVEDINLNLNRHPWGPAMTATTFLESTDLGDTPVIDVSQLTTTAALLAGSWTRRALHETCDNDLVAAILAVVVPAPIELGEPEIEQCATTQTDVAVLLPYWGAPTLLAQAAPVVDGCERVIGNGCVVFTSDADNTEVLTTSLEVTRRRVEAVNHQLAAAREAVADRLIGILARRRRHLAAA